MAYYGADLTGFHLPFNFHLISTDWKPKPVASLIEAYEAALPAGAWPNWVLGSLNVSDAGVFPRQQAQDHVAVALGRGPGPLADDLPPVILMGREQRLLISSCGGPLELHRAVV